MTHMRVTALLLRRAPCRRYIAQKTKEEIRALHGEDPARWSVASLAARFGAPEGNVAAIVRMGCKRRGGEEAREALRAAWVRLPEVSASRGTRGARDLVGVPGPRAGRVESVGVAVEEEGEESMEEEAVEEEVEEDVDEAIVERSVTAQWVEQLCKTAPLDTPRRTTFAFVEVGKGLEDAQRAVWLREGETGRLRAASDPERGVLMGRSRIGSNNRS